MSFPLTTQQRAVVTDRGGCLLVAAAAGSGKTRVLVERLLSRVEDEGLDIDRFLVITYTKAAAAELRSRIVEELSDRLSRSPGDAHLRRQSALVYKAQISTVHAFCAQLLRECGHLLELDPDFRLCDEGEAGILMLRALNDVLDRRYEDIAEGSDFARLVDTMSAGRDDSRLMQIVLDIRGRVQAHPNPAAWLDGQERAFALEGVDDPGETPWGRLLLDDAGRQGAYWRDKIARALELCPCDANLDANYAPSLSATLAALDAFVEGTRRGWDAARAALPIPFPTAGRKKMVDCPDAAEQVKAIRSTCKKRMEKLGEWFEDCGADLLEDLRAVHPAVRGLFALVKDFEGAYAAEKARRGMVDFADLEHMAVRLLVGEDGAPTELARQWSARYDEIMVDEYQDTNEVQNAIFTALSREGRNLFLVGDVKQSIYRFRLADPTIFLGKYRAFADYTRAAEGEERRLILSRNFRSRPEVLEGANFVFRSVMSADFGEMDYTADEALYPGAPFPPDGRYAVELDAVDASAEGEEEKTARDLIEARFAAKRIRTLVDGGFPISDGEGGERPVRPADIVILLRSPNTVLHHYARALGERDIPWEAEGGGDFFAATEVNVALSLLQIVDNPRQDVPLISVLRSPVYGFSADRLAELRAASPDTDFYAALAADGGEDSRAFLAELDELRFGAGELSSHELLWQLYDRTNLLGVFGAMDRGEERQSNLLTLAELARRFEGAGHKGLFGFLSYLTRLRENGAKLALPAPGREGGGVLVVIHDVTEQRKSQELQREFVANVSHELRTPLTNIRSYAETISDSVGDLPPDMEKKFLGVILNETDRMTHIVQDLLTLSRFDSGKDELKLTRFSFSEAVQSLYHAVYMEARRHDHQLKLELEPDLPAIVADRERIVQVMMNVVSNAIKYTPDGGHITISAGRRGDLVWMVVDDDGIGIPAADRPRIFERFYRVDKARSRQSGGTGLGLSIAKEIVTLHQGSLRILDKEGPGLAVCLELNIEGPGHE